MKFSKNQRRVQFGKNNLELAKSLFAELGMAYIDELAKISEDYDNKVKVLEERITEIENILDINLNENDTKLDESKINISENITCPYCGTDFLVEYDETNHETLCPNCNNLIELDWGEFEDDM